MKPIDPKQYPTIHKAAWFMLQDQGIEIDQDKIDLEVPQERHDLPTIEKTLKALSEDALETFSVGDYYKRVEMINCQEMQDAHEFLEDIWKGIGG